MELPRLWPLEFLPNLIRSYVSCSSFLISNWCMSVHIVQYFRIVSLNYCSDIDYTRPIHEKWVHEFTYKTWRWIRLYIESISSWTVSQILIKSSNSQHIPCGWATFYTLCLSQWSPHICETHGLKNTCIDLTKFHRRLINSIELHWWHELQNISMETNERGPVSIYFLPFNPIPWRTLQSFVHKRVV